MTDLEKRLEENRDMAAIAYTLLATGEKKEWFNALSKEEKIQEAWKELARLMGEQIKEKENERV